MLTTVDAKIIGIESAFARFIGLVAKKLPPHSDRDDFMQIVRMSLWRVVKNLPDADLCHPSVASVIKQAIRKALVQHTRNERGRYDTRIDALSFGEDFDAADTTNSSPVEFRDLMEVAARRIAEEWPEDLPLWHEITNPSETTLEILNAYDMRPCGRSVGIPREVLAQALSEITGKRWDKTKVGRALHRHIRPIVREVSGEEE